jgi:hypothetical protein
VEEIMAGFSDEVKKPPVAFLDVYYRASVEDDFLSTSNILDIYPNEDFYFGRSDSWYVWRALARLRRLTSPVNTRVVIQLFRTSTFTSAVSSSKRALQKMGFLPLSTWKTYQPMARI